MRRLVALAAGIGLLAGCGGSSGGPAGALKATDDNLASIRSGTLELDMLTRPHAAAGAASQPFGYRLHGPFSLGAGALPRLAVDYTQIANGHEGTAKLVSDGSKATVTSAGKTVTLSAAQASQLHVVGDAFDKGTLQVERWVRDPKLSAGPNGTDRITGGLDIARALGDLASLAGNAPAPQIGKGERARLESSLRSSSVEVVTGHKDRLLRRLHVVADLGFDVPKDLRHSLGSLVGAKLDLTFGVTDPKTSTQ